MDLPKLPSAIGSTPMRSESSNSLPSPSRGPPLPSRLPRPSLDVQEESPSADTGNIPKLLAKRSPPPLTSHSATLSVDSKPEGKPKKRGRVTPKQLAQLENLFAIESCPSVERRKEISLALGMQERQLQIWFQNRRAKEKVRRGIPSRPRRGQKLSVSVSPPPRPSPGYDSLPSSPPELTPGFDSELTARINEDMPVDIIPCDTLTIGTWKRVRSEESEHSLVAYVCDSQESLTWFIHNAGRSFKMIIPFHIIMHTELEATSSGTTGTTEISFILSRPPLFFLEASIVDQGNTETKREWQVCHDWTEDLQATYCLRHTIQGPAIAFHHFLGTLKPKLASLEMKANFRGPASWRQSPSSASEYSCPTPQGSISPLEMRKRLPSSEFFDHSPEASVRSNWPGSLGYNYPRFTDSSTSGDQPSPPSSDDQSSPIGSVWDQPSPQATTPQYASIDGLPATEVYEPDLQLDPSMMAVHQMTQSHDGSPLAYHGDGDYEQRQPPPPGSGPEPPSSLAAQLPPAAVSPWGFPCFSSQICATSSFPDSSLPPVPITNRYYTLDYGLATGCSSSTIATPTTANSATATTTSSRSTSFILPPTFNQLQPPSLSDGKLNPERTSFYPITPASNLEPSNPTMPTIIPPTPFNQPLDVGPIPPSGLTTSTAFYESEASSTNVDPGLNPDLYQYLQTQMPHQGQQPTLIAPTPFSASAHRLQEDWISGLWEQPQRQQF